MPTWPALGGRDDRRGARALVADRADPARRQHRRAAVVGEPIASVDPERLAQRGAAGDVLAAARRGRAPRRRVRSAAGERGVDRLDPVVELEDRAAAVRRDDDVTVQRHVPSADFGRVIIRWLCLALSG